MISPTTGTPVVAGAEAFTSEGGETAVLLSHGFTGNPSSMKPWADYLARRGYTVSVPRLPGHGTSWQDMNESTWQQWYGEIEDAYLALRPTERPVFVAGLSMGGALVLRLAELHPEVRGVVLLNPGISANDPTMKLLPVLSKVVASFKGVGSDIAKPGVIESAYDRTPLRAAQSMRGLWATLRADLGKVNQPILFFKSRVDHVVDPTSLQYVLYDTTSTDITVRILARSYHVATLDYDAEQIFSESADWITKHS